MSAMVVLFGVAMCLWLAHTGPTKPTPSMHTPPKHRAWPRPHRPLQEDSGTSSIKLLTDLCVCARARACVCVCRRLFPCFALAFAWGSKVQGWQPTVQKMAQVANSSGLSITCTEVGYQSRNYAWIRGLNDVELDPLDCSSTANCVNLLAQSRAYEGLIKALYPHPWFNGVYLWLWRTDPAAGGNADDSYTPQNKPAALVMKELFSGTP